jgi:hypothetical protein
MSRWCSFCMFSWHAEFMCTGPLLFISVFVCTMLLYLPSWTLSRHDAHTCPCTTNSMEQSLQGQQYHRGNFTEQILKLIESSTNNTHGSNIGVQWSLSTDRITGPVFFEDMIYYKRYVQQILHQFFELLTNKKPSMCSSNKLHYCSHNKGIHGCSEVSVWG